MQIIKKAPPGRVEAGKGAAQVQPGVPTPLFYPLNFHRLQEDHPQMAMNRFPSPLFVFLGEKANISAGCESEGEVVSALPRCEE